jgi:hypothetical protein
MDHDNYWSMYLHHLAMFGQEQRERAGQGNSLAAAHERCLGLVCPRGSSDFAPCPTRFPDAVSALSVAADCGAPSSHWLSLAGQ